MEPSQRLQAFLRHELSKIPAEETRDTGLRAQIRRKKDTARKPHKNPPKNPLLAGEVLPEGKEQTWRNLWIEMAYHLIEQETGKVPEHIYEWIAGFLRSTKIDLSNGKTGKLKKRNRRLYTRDDVLRVVYDYQTYDYKPGVRERIHRAELEHLFEYMYKSFCNGMPEMSLDEIVQHVTISFDPKK